MRFLRILECSEKSSQPDLTSSRVKVVPGTKPRLFSPPFSKNKGRRAPPPPPTHTPACRRLAFLARMVIRSLLAPRTLPNCSRARYRARSRCAGTRRSSITTRIRCRAITFFNLVSCLRQTNRCRLTSLPLFTPDSQGVIPERLLETSARRN